jgi:hypothetical protein
MQFSKQKRGFYMDFLNYREGGYGYQVFLLFSFTAYKIAEL